MPVEDAPSVVRFGVFEIDRRSGELRKRGTRVRVRDQSLQILLLLLERPGQVVTRDELQRRLWPADTFVDFDHGLNKAVNRLREVLGDAADSPRFIETLPKRGYRFVASVDAPPAAASPPTRRSIVWIGAAALLTIVAAALAYVRFTRASPTPNEPARIVLAAFDNSTGDAAFDQTLPHALAIDLEQSPVVRTVSAHEVTRALQLMHRRPTERLTPEIARDVCRRANAHAVLAGSVTLLGAEYVLGLVATDCQTGETVARQQVRASRKEDLLAALDDAAKDLRRTLGESRRSIQRFDTRVHDTLTTGSFDAFQAYTNGERSVLTAGGASAVPFFERAIELDPDFAYAHAALGLVLGTMGEARRSTVHSVRAYELRDTVSEWERFFITAQYYDRATGELEKILPVCDLWIHTYPHERTGPNRLAAAYNQLGQPARALAELDNARRLGQDHPIEMDAWALTAMHLDRVPEATTAIQKALAESPNRLALRRTSYRLSRLAGDTKAMEAQIEWASQTPRAESMFAEQADTEAYVGRIAQARTWLERAVAAATSTDLKGSAAVSIAVNAVRDSLLGYVDEARSGAARAVALEESWETDALAAVALARIGDVAGARDLAQKLSAERPSGTLVQKYWLPIIRAESELAAANPARAIELLRTTEQYELADTRLPLLPAFVRGEAYLRAGNGRAAAAEFHKLLDHPGLLANNTLGALARVELARAFVMTGDVKRARTEYEAFLRLWNEADATIPVLSQARSEYRAIVSPQ